MGLERKMAEQEPTGAGWFFLKVIMSFFQKLNPSKTIQQKGAIRNFSSLISLMGFPAVALCSSSSCFEYFKTPNQETDLARLTRAVRKLEGLGILPTIGGEDAIPCGKTWAFRGPVLPRLRSLMQLWVFAHLRSEVNSRQMLNLKMEFSSCYSYRTLGIKVEHSSWSISKTWPALRHRCFIWHGENGTTCSSIHHNQREEKWYQCTHL